MWGNLAGRIGQNLKENAGELLNAVAPPGSDEEYTDEEYEEYTDEEYEEEEDGQTIDFQESKPAGFGALLGRLIDEDEHQHEMEADQKDLSPVSHCLPSLPDENGEEQGHLAVTEAARGENISNNERSSNTPTLTVPMTASTEKRSNLPPPPPPRFSMLSSNTNKNSSPVVFPKQKPPPPPPMRLQVPGKEQPIAKDEKPAKQHEDARKIREEKQEREAEIARQQHEKEQKECKAEILMQQEAERKEREAEIARQQEAARLQLEAELSRQQEEEERKLREVEIARQLEEEKQRQREIEIARKQEEEERKSAEAEIARQQEEEERKRREDEIARRLEEEKQKRRGIEIARQREEERKRTEAELARQQQEENRQIEIARRKEERRQREEIARQKEEEQKQAELSRMEKEEIKLRQQEEETRRLEFEAERKQREEETARQQEERRLQREAEIAQQRKKDVDRISKVDAERTREEEKEAMEQAKNAVIQNVNEKGADNERISCDVDVTRDSVRDCRSNHGDEVVVKLREEISKMKIEAVETSQIRVRNKEMELQLKEVSQQLLHAETHIMELQKNAAQQMDEEESWRASLLTKQQEHETLLLEAEDNKHELEERLQAQEASYTALEQRFEKERAASAKEMEQMRRLAQQMEASMESAEVDKQKALSQQEKASQLEYHRQERAVQMAEEKLARSMAILDERDDEIRNLNTVIDNMRATLSKNQEGAQEAEEEMDELHAENEELQHRLHAMEEERSEMKKQLIELQADHEKVSGLQMELHMLKEARDRDRAQKQTAVESAESNISKTAAERDAALAKIVGLEQQLTAAVADLEVAQSDTARVMTANVNLQNALEAFQSEREAEIAILEEQRVANEEATAAAHAAAIKATYEANEAEMKALQSAADAAVSNVMDEVKTLEVKVEEHRKENVQLRRSLDEAIHRLQTNQEDVIDRTLMKNILLDWFSKNGKGKKAVLEVMASVLHFTEEEKEKIHIGDSPGTLGKVVGAVAAPLPPAKADVEHLEGENVREKWVNFLLAETEGEAENGGNTTIPETNGSAR